MPRSSIVNGRLSTLRLPSIARAATAPAAPAAGADAFADSGKLYVAAIESSIHAFVTIDLDGLITSWSAGAERMFGHTARDMVGGPIDLIVPAGEDLRLAAARARIRQGSRVETYEAVRVAKDGRKVNVVVTLSPIKTPAGAVVGACAILSDVTNQRLAEQLFGLVVEACPSSMIVSDRDGVIVLVNSATERMFGYACGELLGRSIDLLIPERLRCRHVALRSEFAAHPDGGRSSHGRVMLACCKDGSEIGVEVGLNPITIEGRQMVLSVVSDVSERNRIERMKNEFIATVSHELRTPLTSITGSLGLLLGGAAGPQPAPVVRLLSIAHGNSQRLVRLINDLLDIEKIESGQVVFDFRETDIGTLVEQAIDANRGFAEQFRVQVRLDPESSSGPACVDADRIVQVMTNLLSNACKFSPAGGDVDVRIDRNDGGVRVSVRDRGPGIPEEFKSRVFGRFAQADASYGRPKGGSGLGLNIVKQIVTQHGGKVGFDAAPGGGTVFYVDLPAIAEASVRGSIGTDAQPRAMMCSNDLDVSSELSAIIRSRSFPVDVVPTASAALAHAALARYTLFVIDLPMRDLDGVSLIRQLRASAYHADTPIVVVAAERAAGNQDLRYDDLGLAAWLDKPVDLGRFGRILDRAKARRGRPRILHIEDDTAIQELVAHRLKREFDVVAAASIEEAQRALQSGEFDASLLDLGLPDGRGAELLRDLHDRAGHDLPLVVHSGYEADARSSARADAVIMKSHTSINDLVAVLRRLVGNGRMGERSGREVA